LERAPFPLIRPSGTFSRSKKRAKALNDYSLRPALLLGEGARRADGGVADETGLSREQLYRPFSEDGNPTLKSTLAVMKALGIELTAKIPDAAW
jgi:probable addiction module antidote protein